MVFSQMTFSFHLTKNSLTFSAPLEIDVSSLLLPARHWLESIRWFDSAPSQPSIELQVCVAECEIHKDNTQTHIVTHNETSVAEQSAPAKDVIVCHTCTQDDGLDGRCSAPVNEMAAAASRRWRPHNGAAGRRQWAQVTVKRLDQAAVG